MIKIATKVVHYELVEKDKKNNSSVKVVFLGSYQENPFSITTFVLPTKENLVKADELRNNESEIMFEFDDNQVKQAYNRKTGEFIYDADGNPVYNGKASIKQVRDAGFEAYSQLENNLAQLEKITKKKKK